MARFQESDAKQAVRLLLSDAARGLQRRGLTYLGMPAEEAHDVMVLAPLLNSVIAVDASDKVLQETRRTLARLPMKQEFVTADMWEYLRDSYPSHRSIADVAFLDFYGGGLRNDDPYATEIAGLRSYFAKHAQQRDRAFILAWTYMPRDKGRSAYLDACATFLGQPDMARLRKTSGVWLRSAAIRLLVRQSLLEHRMSVSIYQHVMYKKIMNTIILIFCAGTDHACRIPLGSPDSLLSEPVYVYEESLLPRIVTMPEWV
jgi:hypothetical protein